MIIQKDKDQIDQLLEDTFPSQPSPPSRDSHLPTTHPNGEHDGAGTTSPLPASQDSARAATAPAALAPTCCQHPAGSSGSAGKMPAARLPRADQLVELGRMRECVALLKEEIEAGWQAIIAEQQRLGWPDFDTIQDATHALHRATTDLDNVTHEMVCKLRWRPS